jgi:hypothetical protein
MWPGVTVWSHMEMFLFVYVCKTACVHYNGKRSSSCIVCLNKKLWGALWGLIQVFAVLGCYTVLVGIKLLTLQGWYLQSRPGWPMQMGLIGFLETSIIDYQSVLRDIPEDSVSCHLETTKISPQEMYTSKTSVSADKNWQHLYCEWSREVLHK